MVACGPPTRSPNSPNPITGQLRCADSPHQAVSNILASTLMAGGVTVFAGVDDLPKVSLAVLAESLRAVVLCLHAGQDHVLVNGEEASP